MNDNVASFDLSAQDLSLRQERRFQLVGVLALLAAMVYGYRLVGLSVDPARARSLATPLDLAVPFWPDSILAYSMVYVCALYPLFTVRSSRLFSRTVVAYGWVMALSLLIFAAFPVTSAGFRPDIRALDLTRLSHWGTRLTYFVDPPTNCFPSMHLSFAVLSMLVAYSARPLWGLVAAPVVLGIGVSILTMKQHFIADGLAAVLLAGAVWWRQVRPTSLALRGQPGVARSWRGPALYISLQALFYLVFALLFLAGWMPWQA